MSVFCVALGMLKLPIFCICSCFSHTCVFAIISTEQAQKFHIFRLWVATLFVIFTVGRSSTLAEAVPANGTRHCGSESCFTFYHLNPAMNWQAARNFCATENMLLAVVPDLDTQSVLRRFSPGTQPSGTHQAWIGGIRSTDDTWLLLSGKRFESVYGSTLV